MFVDVLNSNLATRILYVFILLCHIIVISVFVHICLGCGTVRRVRFNG